jgi:hypothetical protein
MDQSFVTWFLYGHDFILATFSLSCQDLLLICSEFQLKAYLLVEENLSSHFSIILNNVNRAALS